MGKLVFRLRNVPDDEAEAIRALLQGHHIEFYETSAGSWGVSMPGIWLNDPEDYARARELIDAYEEQRTEEQRAHFASLKAAGEDRTLLDVLKEKPLQVILYTAFSLFILYLSLMPFFELGQ